ncbi:hypothetical protein ACETAC_06545 [Aceticella autotrophica]|uniref:Uncharacterized protein n=1 Tax=Aceticella autotrophica TaxID=2755338 RepID=A0A975AXT7_9THEO|nr:hypothetical protein [Aceticella autotrophica]QSZ28460.1 hypothetical protein ACETAC_06545 [Aceticella autotrophica]
MKKKICQQLLDTNENYYLFDFYNDILEDIGKELNIDFSKKIMKLGEIKKILGETKKS